MTSSEVVDPRIEREARWCYERRLDRMTVRDIADVSLAELGYSLSHSTVARRIRHYHATMLELEGETRDEARARELELLDKAARTVATLADAVDHAATAKARAVAEYHGDDPNDPRLVVLTDPVVRLRAMQELVRQSESRRKLLGTDAPAEHKLDVTVVDAATAELNAMLAEANLPPIPDRETRS